MKSGRTLKKRAILFGDPISEAFPRPRKYPNIPKCCDLRKKIKPEGLKVLNVGVGSGQSWIAQQLPFFRFKQLDHIDIHEPYLEEAKRVIWDAEQINFIHQDIRNFNDFEKYDLVLIFDVLEHLEKEEAFNILDKLKKAIIFIPLEKEFRENTFGVESQEHKSYWTEEDFLSKGFKIEVLNNFHHDENRDWDALWAIK